jgi:hypothetical protein
MVRPFKENPVFFPPGAATLLWNAYNLWYVMAVNHLFVMYVF